VPCAEKLRGQKQSLNQLIVDILRRATATDLSDIVGKWTPDPAFDQVIASQRQIGWGKWK
jgi:hypothetical protein